MKLFKSLLILLLIFILVPIIGLINGLTFPEVIIETLRIWQLITVIIILPTIWYLLIGDFKKFKPYLAIAIIFILLPIIGFEIENNINYSSQQLYSKGNNLLIAYDELTKGRRSDFFSSYNPAAIYLAKSYLNKSINLNPDYDEPRIALAKYYLKKKEYNKVLYQCSFITTDSKLIKTKVLKLESIAYVFLNNISEAERKNNELNLLGVKSKSINWLLNNYKNFSREGLEEYFYIFYYEYDFYENF